jgi:hypothetical protein
MANFTTASPFFSALAEHTEAVATIPCSTLVLVFRHFARRAIPRALTLQKRFSIPIHLPDA